MAAMTVTVDVPQTAYLYFDSDALRRQLTAFARMLVTAPVLRHGDSQREDVHVFDGLHPDWGGDGDVVELAASLRSSRFASRTVDSW